MMQRGSLFFASKVTVEEDESLDSSTSSSEEHIPRKVNRLDWESCFSHCCGVGGSLTRLFTGVRWAKLREVACLHEDTTRRFFKVDGINALVDLSLHPSVHPSLHTFYHCTIPVGSI